VILKLGKGVTRAAVRRAVGGAGRPATFLYTGVLQAKEIRDAVAGIRDAGSPRWAVPVLAWMSSHPNTPEDVLRDLYAEGAPEILMCMVLNPRLPADIKAALVRHEDPEVSELARHVLSRRPAAPAPAPEPEPGGYNGHAARRGTPPAPNRGSRRVQADRRH